MPRGEATRVPRANPHAGLQRRAFHRACERDLGEVYQRAERLMEARAPRNASSHQRAGNRPSVPDLHTGESVQRESRAPQCEGLYSCLPRPRMQHASRVAIRKAVAPLWRGDRSSSLQTVPVLHTISVDDSR